MVEGVAFIALPPTCKPEDRMVMGAGIHFSPKFEGFFRDLFSVQVVSIHFFVTIGTHGHDATPNKEMVSLVKNVDGSKGHALEYLRVVGGPYYGLVRTPVDFMGYASGGVKLDRWHWAFGDGNSTCKEEIINNMMPWLTGMSKKDPKRET